MVLQRKQDAGKILCTGPLVQSIRLIKSATDRVGHGHIMVCSADY